MRFRTRVQRRPTTGEDISATYYDFRDSSGSENEWGDSATIGADTGSVSFDRTVYPVPAAADDDDKGIESHSSHSIRVNR